ncbi:MAG: sugar transferase [Crocosphaera sp.]|nr:sugar transferase [Crocosphaera sp.]
MSDSLSHKSSLPHRSVHNKIKRLIDILGAIIGLLITVILAIPIFIAIQWDDPGPILYSQMRCGLQGKPFRIWKFRSMVINADKQKHLVKNEAKGHFFKSNKDPRVTNIGYFLRHSSLDEFPQFWNVLMGDMSLVGTRPPSLDEVKKYSAYHWQRLAVKPGLTGEWQVNGRSTITDFEDVVKLDLNYQEKWSILYDLQLIVKTIFVVLSCRGAW